MGDLYRGAGFESLPVPPIAQLGISFTESLT